MARNLLVALALAQVSQALLDDYVEIVKTVEVFIPPKDIASDLVHGQANGNPAVTACGIADAVISSCDDKGVLATSVPLSSARDCLCCFSSTAIYPIYSACASYVYNSVDGASTLYSAMSVLWDVCSDAGRGICTGGAQATPTRGNTAASPTRVLSTTAPPACTSVVSVVNSCSRKFGAGASTVRDNIAASCICADGSGNPDTAIEDWASACAPWAKTAASEDYSVISILQTFCDANPFQSGGQNTGAIAFTPITQTGAAGGGATQTPGGIGGQSAPTGASFTQAPGGGGSEGSAPGMVASGILAWAATVVFSFFYFI